jgi:protein phosphatase
MTQKGNISSVSFTGIGKRANNEDAFSAISHKNNIPNIFLVCDGVGGQNKGEIASALVCSSFAEYIEKKQDLLPDDWVQDAIKFAENNFDIQQENNPDTKGMASTLTLVAFRENDVLVAHCGDSRVYHFRDKEILFQTKDHSYTNWLIDRGEITTEEAKTHPKKNVITRCIAGTRNPTKADIQLITNLQVNDYLLLCSDGLLEAYTNEEIAQLMNENNTIETIATQIHTKCNNFANDNYTYTIIKIIK